MNFFCDLSNIFSLNMYKDVSDTRVLEQKLKIWKFRLFFREIVPSRIWISNARNSKVARISSKRENGRERRPTERRFFRRASRVKRIDSFEQINPRRGWKRVRSGQARSWEEKWRRQRVASGNGSGETPDYGFLRFKFLFAVRAFIKDDLCLSRIFFASLTSF